MRWNEYEPFEEESQSTISTQNILKKVYPFIYPYRKIFIGAFFLSFLGVLLMLLQPRILMYLVDKAIPSHNYTPVRNVALLYLGTIVVSSIVGFFAAWLLQVAGVRAVSDIKIKLFDHMLTLGLPYLEKYPVGKLVSRIESDAQRLISLTSTMIQRVLMAGGMLIGTLVMLLIVDYRLFLIVLAVLPIVVGGSYFLFKYLRPFFREERGRYATISGVVSEFLKSVSILQIFNQKKWASGRLQKENESYKNFAAKIGYLEYGIFRGLAFMEVIVTCAVLLFASRWIREGTMTIGALILFSQYISRIYWPIIMLSEQLGEIQRAGGAADRIFSTLDMKPILFETPNPVPFPKDIHHIDFNNVWYGYEPDIPVLKKISFTVRAGQSIAIVGPTGSGKTTILSLLCRFRDPDKGSICINDIDIRNFDLHTLRKQFGLVLQDLYLFPASVRENLVAFREDIPKEQIYDAIRLSQIDSILAQRNLSLDDNLAEGGSDLSYGQRQLLAVARALTVNPTILIFDEATSSVDPGTEQKIQRAINTLIKGRTSFIVAHRLTTIQHCDIILFIQDGKIMEMGNHDELMALKGFYYDLILQQQEGVA
ncbi:MAG: ABC transporter ATP-binding protein [Candidatus Marinimicrobia bacterium]|nr:ABC transporter ATP-binding protein [Candidatus Neomarinimicrobiota bacterium]